MSNGNIMALLLFFIFIIFIAFVLIKKRTSQSIKFEPAVRVLYSIPATKEQIESERQSQEEIIKLLEVNIVASGYFRKEKIPELISLIRTGAIPFGRVNTKIAFDGDAILTVDEKKKLGLNTRMKYSRKFIEYFDPKSFTTIEPKSTLECMHLDAFYRVSRKNDLIRFKKDGFVKQVKIDVINDCFTCNKVKRFKKIYNIDEVPELPLPGCDAPYCRCGYKPIIDRSI